MTAQIRVRDAGGTLRTLSRIRARDEAGDLRVIQRIRVRDASGILQTVWQAMTVDLSDTSASGSGTTATIVSDAVTATPDGGTAPYTYLWTPAAFNSDNIQPSSPTAATTTFRRTGCAVEDTYIGTFYCTVTDALGVVATSGAVVVDISRFA